MKIKLLALCFLLLGFQGFAQRKKPIAKPKVINVLAKLDNVSAQMLQNNLYLLNANVGVDAKTDTIVLKMNVQKTMPYDCKISLVKLKTNQFYLVSWTENEITNTKLKTEDAVTTFTEICDFTNKSKVFSSFQKTTKIKEIRYLDAKQSVSETIDKVRKEGNEFKILPDGTVIQTNKKGETKWVFSAKDKMYIIKTK